MNIHFHSTVGEVKRTIYKSQNSTKDESSKSKIIFDVLPLSVSEEIVVVPENYTVYQGNNFEKNGK